MKSTIIATILGTAVTTTVLGIANPVSAASFSGSLFTVTLSWVSQTGVNVSDQGGSNAFSTSSRSGSGSNPLVTNPTSAYSGITLTYNGGSISGNAGVLPTGIGLSSAKTYGNSDKIKFTNTSETQKTIDFTGAYTATLSINTANNLQKASAKYGFKVVKESGGTALADKKDSVIIPLNSGSKSDGVTISAGTFVVTSLTLGGGQSQTVYIDASYTGNGYGLQGDAEEVPEPLAMLSAGVVLGAIPVLKRKYARRNNKKDGDA